MDWKQAVEYQPLPSHVPQLDALCESRAWQDRQTGKFFVVLRGTVGEIPDTEPLPIGYSNFWHDQCEADVSTATLRPVSTTLKQYQKPSEQIILSRISSGNIVYWLSETGQRCAPVRIEKLKRPAPKTRDQNHSDGSLEAFVSVAVPESVHWGRFVVEPDIGEWIPYVLVPPTDSHLGYILMGTWQKDGRPLMKCQCERLLRIMSVNNDGADMLPRRLPTDSPPRFATWREPPSQKEEVRFYNQDQVEKWFWTEKTCERARLQSLDAIRRDGRNSIRSGFYGGYASVE